MGRQTCGQGRRCDFRVCLYTKSTKQAPRDPADIDLSKPIDEQQLQQRQKQESGGDRRGDNDQLISLLRGMLVPEPSHRLSAGECLAFESVFPSVSSSLLGRSPHDSSVDAAAHKMVSAPASAATTTAATRAAVNDDQRQFDDVGQNNEECPKPVRSELVQSEPVESEPVQSESSPPKPVPCEAAPSERIPLEPAPTEPGEAGSDSHGPPTFTAACQAVATTERNAVNPAFDVQQEHEVNYSTPDNVENGGADSK